MKNKLLSTLSPVLVLFILSPVIAELLFGSTPVSRSPQLIMESLYYGSGAVLIREFVRRRNLGWMSVIVLGIAFGVLEECVTLQSVFNPDFLHNNLTYGRLCGVNWVWGMCIIAYHAIWSISIPVLFTELLFPGKQSQAWLGKIGDWIICGIYILSSLAFYAVFYKMSGFQASMIHIMAAFLLATVLVILAVNMPAARVSRNYFSHAPSFVAGIVSFIASLLWFGILILVFSPNKVVAPWIAVLAGILLIQLVLCLLLNWSLPDRDDRHRFFLAAGCLYASMIFGLNTLYQSKNWLDIVSQTGLIILVTILLILLGKRVPGFKKA